MADYLAPTDFKAVTERLGALPRSVALDLAISADPTPSERAAEALAGDLVAMAPAGRLTLTRRPLPPGEIGPKLHLVPAPGDQPFGVSFWGVPSGHEFSALIDALGVAVGPIPNLQPPAGDLLGALAAPVTVSLFVSPT